MAKHLISNCGHDEFGGGRNGAAGDQTGTEWELRAWYNRPWSCVLRYPNATVANTIARLATEAANNNNIGYDMNERLTYWYALKDAKYSPKAIKVKCESDCSAGVTANVKAAGYILGIEAFKDLPIYLTTWGIREYFRKAGFTVLTSSKYLNSPDYLLPGDILLNDEHHVATNISTGSAVTGDVLSDSSVELPTNSSKSFKVVSSGVCTGDCVNIRKEPNGEVLTQIDKGHMIELDGYETNRWKHCRISKNGSSYVGYIFGTYVGKSSATKDVTAIAKEVILGKWGNGDKRKKLLTAAGYSYKEVQNKVNDLLKQ